VRRILVLGPDDRIDLKGRLIGKHELAIDDFHARTERRPARRVADREKQLSARLEDVLERITRFGQSPCRSATRTTTVRPASPTSSTHGGQI
jgi:Uri superfamily endonuclease